MGESKRRKANGAAPGIAVLGRSFSSMAEAVMFHGLNPPAGSPGDTGEAFYEHIMALAGRSLRDGAACFRMDERAYMACLDECDGPARAVEYAKSLRLPEHGVFIEVHLRGGRDRPLAMGILALPVPGGAPESADLWYIALGRGEFGNELRLFAMGSAFRPPDAAIPGVDAPDLAAQWGLIQRLARDQARGFGLPADSEGAATVEYAQRFRLVRLKGWKGTLDDNEKGTLIEQSKAVLVVMRLLSEGRLVLAPDEGGTPPVSRVLSVLPKE